jgi:hypothetical protein
MGHRKYTVHRQSQKFIQYDEEMLRKLSEKPDDSEEYIFKVRELIKRQEDQLEEDLKRGIIDDSTMWNSEQMRMAAKENNEA